MSCPRKTLLTCAWVLAASLVLANPSHANITFNFDTGGNTIDPQALAGFNQAASLWSSALSDNITVNITIGFSSLGSGILGQASSSETSYSYSAFKAAMGTRATSASDALAVAALQAGTSYNVLINGTTTNTNPHTATFNEVSLTNANAKALGLIAATATPQDAFIEFNSDFAFDFNPNDGINSGQFDFVGIAAHEIGHSLGFISGVDVLDANFNGFPDNAFNGFVSSLDMFRYSSRVSGGTIDWTADGTDKYFSLDRGTTNLGLFSTGVDHGDGRQASHWKDGLALGIMDPTAAPGERLAISNLDLRAFDVIGYRLVPEPGSIALMGVGVFAVILVRVRRREKEAPANAA